MVERYIKIISKTALIAFAMASCTGVDNAGIALARVLADPTSIVDVINEATYDPFALRREVEKSFQDPVYIRSKDNYGMTCYILSERTVAKEKNMHYITSKEYDALFPQDKIMGGVNFAALKETLATRKNYRDPVYAYKPSGGLLPATFYGLMERDVAKSQGLEYYTPQENDFINPITYNLD